jgi:hypothetical protein
MILKKLNPVTNGTRHQFNLKKNADVNIDFSKNIEVALVFDKKNISIFKPNLFLNNYIKQTFTAVKTSINYYPIKSNLKDFYRSNKFTKNSIIMSNCSKDKILNYTNFK